MPATPIVVDCDPGHDDALALMLALGSPELDLLGVCTVAGNQTVQLSTVNALRVLEHVGAAHVPVASGADRPLVGELAATREVHGESGLDGAELPPPRGAPVGEPAVEWLARLLHSRVQVGAEPITLVAIAPLTNVALLLQRHPAAARGIARVVMMGGAIAGGNRTAAAEFNVWADPLAAQRVFDGGLPLAMVGLDVTSRALVDAATIARLDGAGRAGALAARLCRFRAAVHERRRGVAAAPVHDAVAMAHLVDPAVLRMQPMAVSVDTSTQASRGRTFVAPDRAARVNCEVAVDIDRERFMRLLVARIAALG